MRRLILSALLLAGCPSTGDDDDGRTPTPDTGMMTMTSPDAGMMMMGQPDSGLLTSLGPCVAPVPLPRDPLVREDGVNAKDHPMWPRGQVHMVDLARDSRGVTFGVGVGGLFAFGETPGLEFLSFFQGLRDPSKIEVLDGDVLAITDRDVGLMIVDVSNPAQMQEIRRVMIDDPSGIGFIAPYLFVMTHTGEMIVLDHANGDQEITRLGGFGNPWDITIVGTRGYVADNTLGVVVVDLSTPTAPQIVTSVDALGGVQDLSVDGALYAAVGGAGIQSFDLSNPDAPTPLGNVAYGASIVSVSAGAGLVWGTNHEGVVVLDAADPANLLPLATQETEQWAMDVLADGSRAFVTDWESMEIYRVETAARSPDADVARSELYFVEGNDTATLQLANRGADVLTIAGAEIDDDRFTLAVDRTRIDPGEAATFVINFTSDGASVDAELCIATNDPEEAIARVSLQDSNDTNTSIAIGQTAIDFVLPDLDGNTHQLSAQLGNPVVLVYFATW